MTVHNKPQAQTALKGGIIAGLVGGLVLSLFLLAITALQGGDIWIAFKGAGAPFLGDRALTPGFDAGAVVVGVLSHFAVSVGWGVLFALLFFGLGTTGTLLAGLLWGLVVWIGMYYVLLPLLGLTAIARGTPVGMAIVQHLVYGLAVAAAFLPYQRRQPGGSAMRGAPRPSL